MKYIKKAKERKVEEEKILSQQVASIIEKIKGKGDQALLSFNKEFDQCERKKLRLSKEEIEIAYTKVSKEEIENMKTAAKNIEYFAKKQRETLVDLKEVSPTEGVFLGHRVIPVDSCLCYVPGGSYPLYSTALMLGIPAKMAGVKRVVGCSPVMKGTDDINPKTVVAMDIAGVDEIYAIGGAQSIGAFSYGTDSIKPVKLIVGPGNKFVTEAKRQCYGKVGIDFVAGPSEVLVISDETGDSEIIGADLLAQSEHDYIAKGILITTSEQVAREVLKEVDKQLETLSTRNIAEKSWKDYGEVILVDTMEEAIKYTNDYAPEHLELHGEKAEEINEELHNYGSLFIGSGTAEVFGDYASGTNHTLPTLGAAAYTGGVWVGTFLKVCTYQRMDKRGVKQLSPLVESLAMGEGLAGHSYAAKIRRGK